MYKNLLAVGGMRYNDAEIKFAQQILDTYDGDFQIESAEEIIPYSLAKRTGAGSTDVGDVSWKVPTAGMSAATWVPGTSAHTWQAVAAGGTSIGIKGMLIAAKTIALTAQNVFTDPDLIVRANKELEERIGKNDPYKALIGDRNPPLDYRN
jgi:aminobenzoyl-glutamate utilization protein B